MMKISSRISLVGMVAMALVLALVAPGCETGGVTEPGQIVFPEANVSYGRYVQPLFDVGCSFSGCHNEIDRAGGQSLHAYIDLFQVPGTVRPGDSTGSVLWQVVTGRLPHGGAQLYPNLINANHQHGIAVWIQEGARNN